jgi:hypothetical protein
VFSTTAVVVQQIFALHPRRGKGVVGLPVKWFGRVGPAVFLFQGIWIVNPAIQQYPVYSQGVLNVLQWIFVQNQNVGQFTRF